MKIEEKRRIVEELHERFSRSQVAIVTDYMGLNVQAITDLRRRLREANIDFQVVKNTLLIRASQNTDLDLIKGAFTGPSAIALSYDDPVAPAKILTTFAKENEKLEIKAGVMSGKALAPQEIKALAALPSREELLAKVLSAMVGVPTALVRVLNGVPQQFLNVLNSIKEQKEAA